MRNEKYKQDIIPGIVLMIFSIGYLAMIPSIVEFKGIVVTVIVVIFSVRANRKDALRAQQEELAQMAKLKAARNDGE